MNVELSEESKRRLNGFVVEQLTHRWESLIIEEVSTMGLYDMGTLAGRYRIIGEGENTKIENDVGYAAYIEFGTFAYFDIFGIDDFPNKPDPKKKNLSSKQRKSYPKGMQPFAPVRRAMAKLIAMKPMIIMEAKNGA